MRKSVLAVVKTITGIILMQGAAGMAATYPLGPDGAIDHWLMLGYLPIPGDAAGRQANFDRDLLTDAGGEAGVRPVAGETGVVQGRPYVWQLAPARVHTMLKYGVWRPYVQLFHGEKGEPLLDVAAYLHVRLVCEEAGEGRLLFGTDDGAKAYVNGKLVYRYPKGRPLIQDDEDVMIALNKGPNDLLFRIENYGGYGGLQARLVDAAGAPLRGVTVQLEGVIPSTPALAARESVPWREVVSAISPVPAAGNELGFGSRLSRTLSLLESGRITHRPVRLLFYGQSIDEQEWTTLLVNRLRERYPDTPIVAENYAIGGWGVALLVKRFKHDILRLQPDLIEFHAYGGNESTWARVLTQIRRETTADIMIRTAHQPNFDAADMPKALEAYDNEALLLRGLAAQYGAELVEVRQEWMDYLAVNRLSASDLLADGIHLNHKGNVLMAQLYERHFRMSPLAAGGWSDRVRHYEAVRPLADRQDDEIILSGDGWKLKERWVESVSTNDALTLTFFGNRIDIVLAPCSGGAHVRIDGKPPSALGLFHGTGPMPRRRYAPVPAKLVRFFEGPGVMEEAWELRFKGVGADGKSFRFALKGSKTGPDGEGDNQHEFVSQSGRIAISPDDWLLGGPYKPDPAEPEPHLCWSILPDSRDTIQGISREPKAGAVPLIPYTYVTVADGLKCGWHTITLVPKGDGSVCIQAIETHRPPLAGIPGNYP